MIGPVVLMAMLMEVSPVQWSISAPTGKSTVAAGAKVEVTLTASIAPGWHLYSLKNLEGGPIPTSIAVPEGQPFQMTGAIDAMAPLAKFDDTFQLDVETYEGSAEFVLPVGAAKDAKAGATTLVVNARFQVCDDKQCLPPRTVKVELPLEIK